MKKILAVFPEERYATRLFLGEAGIGSPPLSPLRAARSVPDLHIPSELYRGW